MSDVTLSVPVDEKITAACDPGPRAQTTHVFVHCTAGPSGSQQADYESTLGYFADPANRASAHLVIGPSQTTRMVHDVDLAWHARYNNRTALGFELAMPAIGVAQRWAYTDYQYTAAAELTRKWCEAAGIPTMRVLTEAQPGIIGHEDSEQGKADGKEDPGIGCFDWPRFMALVHAPAGPVPAGVNVAELGTFARWTLASLAAGPTDPITGTLGRARFALHVRALGGDQNDLGRYGFPCV